MSATTGNVDSGLSGKPSDNIDQQKGPATGSNAESPGGTLGTDTKPVAAGSNPPNQDSTADQSGSSGTDNNAQQPTANDGKQ